MKPLTRWGAPFVIVGAMWTASALGTALTGVSDEQLQRQTVLIHVAGPNDSGGDYHAEEDTAWCVAPSVEISYTSNPDGSGTVECSVTK